MFDGSRCTLTIRIRRVEQALLAVFAAAADDGTLLSVADLLDILHARGAVVHRRPLVPFALRFGIDARLAGPRVLGGWGRETTANVPGAQLFNCFLILGTLVHIHLAFVLLALHRFSRLAGCLLPITAAAADLPLTLRLAACNVEFVGPLIGTAPGCRLLSAGRFLGSVQLATGAALFLAFGLFLF